MQKFLAIFSDLNFHKPYYMLQNIEIAQKRRETLSETLAPELAPMQSQHIPTSQI